MFIVQQLSLVCIPADKPPHHQSALLGSNGMESSTTLEASHSSSTEWKQKSYVGLGNSTTGIQTSSPNSPLVEIDSH